MGANTDRSEKRRKFLRGIGEIVLGVLIALALGAVATSIGWALDVRSAKQAIGEELGEILGQGQERQRIYPCFERKFAAIAQILTQADETGRLPPLGPIGNPVWRTWSHNVWDSTIGSDTASHFDRGTLDNISGVYEFVTTMNRSSDQEQDAWRRLYAMVGPGRAIDKREVANLRDALSSARFANRIMAASAVRMEQITKAFDLPVNSDTVAQYGNTPINRYCSPIAAPDGSPYGEAPMGNTFEGVKADPITKESTGMSK